MRCDRAHPCGPCSRRGAGHACVYPCPTPNQSFAAPSVEIDLAKRVKQLEQLVSSMTPDHMGPAPSRELEDQSVTPTRSFFPSHQVGNENILPSPPPSSIPAVLRRVNGSSHFVESMHWTAILDEVCRASLVMFLLIIVYHQLSFQEHNCCPRQYSNISRANTS